MTDTAIDPKAAVEVAKNAADILPEAGRAEVLEHLLSQVTAEALKAVSPRALAKLQALLGTEAAPSSNDTTHAGSAGEARIIRNGGHLVVHVPTCANTKIQVQAQRLNPGADWENYGTPVAVELNGDGYGNATLEVDQSCERLFFLFSHGNEWKVLPLFDPTKKKSVLR